MRLSPSANVFLQYLLRSVFLWVLSVISRLFSFPFFFQLLPPLCCFIHFTVYEPHLLPTFTEGGIYGDAFSFSLKTLYTFQELKKKEAYLCRIAHTGSCCVCFCCYGFVFRSCNPYPCTFRVKSCRDTKEITLIIGNVGILIKQ